MTPLVQRLFLLLAMALLGCAGGCFGVSQNPSYFPFLFPTGDIITTHDKPGLGVYSNFDPKAVRIEVRPIPDRTNPVRTQHALIATVYDGDGPDAKPLRNRRVVWLLEGVGHIIEVDESGIFPARGYKVTDKYAVSHTSCREHRVTRGNQDDADDFMIRPGQTWCIVSSPIEGDTHVTLYAPGIFNWQKNQTYTTVRWVDATWEFPAPVQARAGTQAALTTRVFRFTDKRPLEGYRVRYHIVDGPPALMPNGQQQYEAISDAFGNATVVVRQPQTAIGVNKIAIEIVRPPDPTAPSGAGVVIGQGQTSIQWLAPTLQLSHTGPSFAAVGQDVVYETTIVNTGQVESQAMTVSSMVPDGLQYLPGNPRAIGEPALEGRTLSWALGILPPGKAHKVAVAYKALKPGTFQHCAAVTTIEGLRQEQCVTTTVGTAQLKVNVTGPQAVGINSPVNFQITLTNPGSVPLSNVLLLASLSDGLQHSSGAKTLTLGPETLGAGESKNLPLTVTATKPGAQVLRVQASSDSLTDQAEAAVLVQQPQVGLQIEGPRTLYSGRAGTFFVTVANTGDSPLNNVVVRNRLPMELQFQGADANGQFQNGEVLWNLGGLQARETRRLQLNLAAQAPTKAATQSALVAADGEAQAQASFSTEIVPTPAAFRLFMKDDVDPVQVGQTVRYTIKVTNTGQAPANKIQVAAKVPANLEVVRAVDPQGQPGQAQGGVVQFNIFNNLLKDQELQFLIEAKALRPGDIRFRVELLAEGLDPLQGPVFEEESTRIIEATGAAPPPPGSPPGSTPPPPGGTGTSTSPQPPNDDPSPAPPGM